MNTNNNIIALSLATLLPLSAFAAQPIPKELSYTSGVQAAQVAPPKAGAKKVLNTEDNKETVKYDRLFPLMAQRAYDLGYELPKPYGINLSYMNIRQNIDVDSIEFSGLAIGTVNLPNELYLIDVISTRQRSETTNLRFDTWVFPFLNLYGILGYTDGSSNSKVNVDSNPDDFKDNFALKIISRMIHSLNIKGDLKDIDFNLKFKGLTYGAGMTLAGGYGNMFTILDANLTRTSFDILDGQIDAFTLSPRVGYRFNIPAIDFLNLGPTRLNVWAGAMYQKVQQEFKGKLSDLNMPASLAGLMETANKAGLGQFRVKQHLNAPLNMALGAQYELSPHFNILTEFGFNKRNSFFVAGEYRF